MNFIMSELHGTRLEDADVEMLRSGVPSVPSSLTDLMVTYPLVGTELSTTEEDDSSGIGVEMRWMDVGQIIGEATEAYPGIAAVQAGYIPIGMCLLGSGDPYFFRSCDSAVVRIPHTAVTTSDELLESKVEVVASSVEELIRISMVR